MEIYPALDAVSPHHRYAHIVHDPAANPIAFVSGDENDALVLPLGDGDGICPWCHGILLEHDSMCFNCVDNARALDGVIQPIIPISLYSKPSPLRDWLTFYKDDAEIPASEAARHAIGTVLERFFAENHAWAASLDADGIIVVPSTLRPPPHPLAVLLQERGTLSVRLHGGLHRTGASLGHNRPSKDAFTADETLRGKRILLLDDVYTSGARAQSAAYALRKIGAKVVALCVIGRRYNPDYSEQSAAIFARQSSSAFTWAADVRTTTRTSGV